MMNFSINEIPIIFKSVDSVLNVLSGFNNDPKVGELLQIYHTKKQMSNNSNGSGSKDHPLIVLEGLDASGKTTLCKKLAQARHAKLWDTPPKCLHQLRANFEDHKLLRTAFYALGNYIAAEELKMFLKDRPVVLDRFWHSTAAYALAQNVQNSQNSNGDFNLPGNDDDIYEWPTDLLKPDVVFYLDVSESVRLGRIAGRKNVTQQELLLKSNMEFRKNILTAYERMRDPAIVKINADVSIEFVLRDLMERTKHLF